jgi:excisionase family DNA binding protein
MKTATNPGTAIDEAENHGTAIDVAEDRFISIADAAAYLGVDPMTVRNMLRDGRLQAWTLGPRVLRIRLSDIKAALQPYGGAALPQ